MALVSDRLKLPLLAAAQAQKEITHNEALTLADIAMQAVVVSVAPASIPVSPVPGQCWIAGAMPTGAWAGHPGAIAAWTQGGWRFVDGVEGMQVWSIADGVTVRRTATAWVTGVLTANTLSIGGLQVVGPRAAYVALPSGGATIDAEVRAALASVIAGLETHGLFAVT